MLSDEMLYCAYAVIVGDMTGMVGNDEERRVMVMAVEAAGSPKEFLDRVELMGILKSSQLFRFLREYLLCPEKYPQTAELTDFHGQRLMGTSYLTDLAAHLLTARQKNLFNTLWNDFNAEHRSTRYDSKRKVWRKCKYADASMDNDATLPRFYTYCMGIMHGRNKTLCALYDGFPEETVFSVLSSAFNIALAWHK